MRRSSLLLVLGVMGCGALKDAFSPRAEVIARANDQTLSVERVADWAGSSKQVPLEALALSRLSHVWVDYALFAQALAEGKDLRDSATALAAMWPIVSQLKWERLHDRLVKQGDLSAQQVDSVYAAGQLRMFQHILIQVPPNSTPVVEAQKRRKAEQLLPQARTAGTRFAQIASSNSDDPGSRVQGGALGLTARGQFVPAFEDAAWQLKPGEVSAVVKSPFGFHIIRRPPLGEVRESFRTGVQERIASLTDSLYLDSLATKKKIEPVSRAPEYVKAAVLDLEAARSSNRKLVEYRGGSLRVKHLVRWLSALDPQVMQALPQATDDQINQFLKAIAQRDLLIQLADSAKVTLTPEDWQQIRAEHDSAIMTLGSILNISPQMLRDSAATPDERTNIAMARVNDYVERVLQGRARFFPVPPFLGETLRERADWKVDEAGVRRAVERAQQIRTASDSNRTNQPRMTPAPGPAPIDTSPPGSATPGGAGTRRN
ncbi:MAG TPA: peptidylprolyl isomerase [Gemmatimonadales bacterium]|nr:peptidylprolyl isomerase [Gemmatimonadales bacterium]